MSLVANVILYDENPQGLRAVELDNWQGKAFVVPRASLKVFRQRPEATEQGGIYVLFGDGDKKPIAYVGQTDNIGGRLSEHDRSREETEWNIALVFIGNLDSTSVRYLESMAVDVAKKAGRYEISNSTTPRGGRYSEAQGIKVEGFFKRMKLVTGLLGFPVFDNPQTNRDREVYIFEDVRNKDGSGRGTLLSTGEFIVFKDSWARAQEKPGLHPGGRALRRKLLDEGVLKKLNDKSYVFTQDYIFTSPSAASGVIAARSTNGWDCWKDNEGRTLDEIKRK